MLRVALDFNVEKVVYTQLGQLSPPHDADTMMYSTSWKKRKHHFVSKHMNRKDR